MADEMLPPQTLDPSTILDLATADVLTISMRSVEFQEARKNTPEGEAALLKGLQPSQLRLTVLLHNYLKDHVGEVMRQKDMAVGLGFEPDSTQPEISKVLIRFAAYFNRTVIAMGKGGGSMYTPIELPEIVWQAYNLQQAIPGTSHIRSDDASVRHTQIMTRLNKILTEIINLHEGTAKPVGRQVENATTQQQQQQQRPYLDPILIDKLITINEKHYEINKIEGWKVEDYLLDLFNTIRILDTMIPDVMELISKAIAKAK
jgi:hypothetical protein